MPAFCFLPFLQHSRINVFEIHHSQHSAACILYYIVLHTNPRNSAPTLSFSHFESIPLITISYAFVIICAPTPQTHPQKLILILYSHRHSVKADILKNIIQTSSTECIPVRRLHIPANIPNYTITVTSSYLHSKNNFKFLEMLLLHITVSCPILSLQNRLPSLSSQP